MGGYACECANCDELNYERDMVYIGGEYYCDCCSDVVKIKRELITLRALMCEECGAANDKKHWAHDEEECPKCGKKFPECALIEKLEGLRCPLCSHKIERELCDHDKTTCKLCELVEAV